MESVVLFANKLELRYYFNDKSVYMDAMVRNRCEKEMLLLIRFVAETLDVKMMIYSEPSVKEGGYSELWGIAGRHPYAHSIVLTIVMHLMARPLVTPDGTSTAVPFNEHKFRDDIKRLRNQLQEKKKVVILPPDLVAQLDTQLRIRRSKSAFYDAVRSYPKVNRLVFREVDENNRNRSGSLEVRREQFAQYIVKASDLADDRAATHKTDDDRQLSLFGD